MKQGKLLFAVVTLFFLFLPSHVSAQTKRTPPVLSLEECLHIGLQQNLKLQASRLAIEKANYLAKAARADFFPKLRIEGTYRWLDNPVKIEIPEITIHTPMGPIVSPPATVSEAAKNTGTLTTSLVQPLFTGGALTERYKLASLDTVKEKNRYENAKQYLIESIKFAYYDLVKAYKIHSLAGEYVKQLEAHLKTAKAFLDENIIPLNDYLQSKVTLSNARLNLIKTRNNLKIAQSYLNLLMNRDINLPIQPETEFRIVVLPNPLSYYQNLALHHRPDLKVATTRVQQAKSAIRLAKSSYFPHVTLSLNYRDLSDESLEEDSASILVMANWSIFEWNKRKWQVDAQKARFEQALLVENSLRQQILHEVKTAYLNVSQSLKRIATIKDAVEQAKENLRINQLRYKEQVATSTDVIDAQTLLLKTEINLTVAKIDYLKALSALEKAVGKTLTEESP